MLELQLFEQILSCVISRLFITNLMNSTNIYY